MVDNGKIAVVTGGAGALGQALAAALVPHYPVVHAPSRAELDVSQPSSIGDYFQRLPRVDLLINNAGSSHDQLVVRETEQAWNSLLNTNLRGAALCAQAALPLMPRGGCIFFVGSHAAFTGSVGLAAYAASKAGLSGLMLSIAREQGPAGIRSLLICPGFLETPMTANLPAQTREHFLSEHLLPEPNTVADTARFIAELTTYPHLSGQVFHLDSRPLPWT